MKIRLTRARFAIAMGMCVLFSLAIANCSALTSIVGVDGADHTESPPTTEIELTSTNTPKPSITSMPDQEPTQTVQTIEPPTRYASIPLGTHLVYFDLNNGTLNLLSPERENQDIILISRLASFSRDAEKLAYFEEASLSIADLINGEISRQQMDFSCSELPSWSADASKLAIGCENKILIFSLLDLSLDTLTDWGVESVDSFLDPHWSPTEDRVAYFYRDLNTLGASERNGIYVTEVECITSDDSCKEDTIGPLFPYSNNPLITWSPNGQFIAAFLDDLEVLEIVDIDTRESRTVIKNIESIDGLTWSPEGDQLIYSADGSFYQVSGEGGEPNLLIDKNGYVISWVMKLGE